MIKVKKGPKIDTVFVLLTFCVFAAAVLVVLMFSAKTYKNMTDLSREGYNDQTGLSYIWSRVKNEDEAGRIYVSDFEGQPALCFNQVYNNVPYRTMIYAYNGWIRELFCQANMEFYPEDGVPVIEANTFSIEQLENGLIKVATDSGSLLVHPRGKAGAPGIPVTPEVPALQETTDTLETPADEMPETPETPADDTDELRPFGF